MSELLEAIVGKLSHGWQQAVVAVLLGILLPYLLVVARSNRIYYRCTWWWGSSAHAFARLRLSEIDNLIDRIEEAYENPHAVGWRSQKTGIENLNYVVGGIACLCIVAFLQPDAPSYVGSIILFFGISFAAMFVMKSNERSRHLGLILSDPTTWLRSEVDSVDLRHVPNEQVNNHIKHKDALIVRIDKLSKRLAQRSSSNDRTSLPEPSENDAELADTIRDTSKKLIEDKAANPLDKNPELI
jgi:hypothetical protein